MDFCDFQTFSDILVRFQPNSHTAMTRWIDPWTRFVRNPVYAKKGPMDPMGPGPRGAAATAAEQCQLATLPGSRSRFQDPELLSRIQDPCVASMNIMTHPRRTAVQSLSTRVCAFLLATRFVPTPQSRSIPNSFVRIAHSEPTHATMARCLRCDMDEFGMHAVPRYRNTKETEAPG